MWAVYALHEPTGEVRYIGIAKDPIDRVKRHYRECRYGNTHRKTWLRSLFLNGKEPLYSVLEWTDDWSEAERRWIAYFIASGAKLVNGNAGGKTHRGTRVPNPHPTIKRMYRMLESNSRSKYASPRAVEILDKFRETIALCRKRGTLDQVEQRLAAMSAH